MPGTEPTQWIELTDFSPGIFSGWQSGTTVQAAPDGAAQLSGTYGCVASPTGGLIPGPAVTKQKLQPLIDLPTTAGHYPAGDVKLHVTAFRVASPISTSALPIYFYADSPTYPTDLPNTDYCFYIFEWHYVASGNSNFTRKVRVVGHKHFLSPQTEFVIENYTSAPLGSDGPFGYGLGSIDLTRTNNSNPLEPGRPQMVYAYFHDVASAARMYPDPDNPTTDSSEVLGFAASSIFPAFVFSHQDRVFAIHLSNVNQFGGNSASASAEALAALPANDATGSSTDSSIFVNENPGGVGSWVSMNASELLIIKRAAGGYVLRGDFENPSISRLPGLAPAEPMNLGVVASSGYFYGNYRGVWAWSGGDVTQHVSPQIDGPFWLVESLNAGPDAPALTDYDSYHFGIVGRFAWQHPFVFVPNNFLFDTRSNGWWRLGQKDSPAAVYYDTNSSGQVLATVGHVSPIQPILTEWYDLDKGQPEWSWRSQPLLRTKGRVFQFREIVIMAQGYGTIDITLTGLDGETQKESFDITTGTASPEMQRKQTSIQTHDVVVDISSRGSNGNTAPSVMRLGLGHDETITVA